jgi:Fur family ferric uptake transcriptional regulator
MDRQFESLLQKNHLKVTGARMGVLKILADRDAAISQPALEKLMGSDVDRVTLYRILKTFEEKGIVHKVMDLDGTANYATCSSNCTADAHHDEHFHFNCTNCKKVYCFNDLHLPFLRIPAGFTAESVNLILTGICKHCNSLK